MASQPMRNPVLIELTRGALVESVHAGAIAVVRADGEVVAAVGDIARPIFPRSAIKPLQALPFLESGAADRFGFGRTRDRACQRLACRRRGARCRGDGDAGRRRPLGGGAGLRSARADGRRQRSESWCDPAPRHRPPTTTARASMRPCWPRQASGRADRRYWRPDHPVQQRIRHALEDMTGCALGADALGIDGCSVPNWAMPLVGLARAFARLGTGEELAPERAEACRRIRQACWAHPELVAGQGQLVTEILQRLGGRVLVKSGAEGVYCGAFVDRGLGFALKIDDGAKRAAEAAVVQVVARLHPSARQLGPDPGIANWRGLRVGEVRAADALEAMLARLA